MLSLSDNNQTDINEAFNCSSRYSDDILNTECQHSQNNAA